LDGGLTLRSSSLALPVLIVAAEVLLLPVWLAKAVAILASFVVNFSLSHFVVFRVRDAAGERRDV
jgi:putative flippase GtrA